jgi:hypothetical protein
MVEGYFKPSLVLRGDFVARQFFDCLFGPTRCSGDPQVSLVLRLGISHEVAQKCRKWRPQIHKL